MISTHTLTWSVTFWGGSKGKICQFQLTRSRGAWPHFTTLALYYTNFNSHAHVERDAPESDMKMVLLSFQLTRSRGAWPLRMSANSSMWSFQLTRSRGAWLLPILLFTVSGLFQLTRSRGAWPHRVLITRCGRKFQLTRSRGAWQTYKRCYNATGDFNSHAHVERD